MRVCVIPPIIRRLVIDLNDQVVMVEVLDQGDWSDKGRKLKPVGLCPGGYY
jgi:hypothetical protein